MRIAYPLLPLYTKTKTKTETKTETKTKRLKDKDKTTPQKAEFLKVDT